MIAVKAAIGAATPHEASRPCSTLLIPFDDLAEAHAASPTAHLLDELALFGHRPYQDDPDPRPLPEPEEARCAMIGIFSTAQDLLCDTRLEGDLQDVLWGFVNSFHRKLDRIERELDDNEVAQRRSQGEQDGSEVRSVELERLIDQGKTLIERRNSFEFLRDASRRAPTRFTPAWPGGPAWDR